MSGVAGPVEVLPAPPGSGLATWREPPRWRAGEEDARAAVHAAAEELGAEAAAAARRLLAGRDAAAGRLLARRLEAAHPGGDHAPCCLWLVWRAVRAEAPGAGAAAPDAGHAGAELAAALELAAVAAAREARARPGAGRAAALGERARARRGVRAARRALAAALRSCVRLASTDPFAVCGGVAGRLGDAQEAMASHACGGTGRDSRRHGPAAARQASRHGMAPDSAPPGTPPAPGGDAPSVPGRSGGAMVTVAPRARKAVAQLERSERMRLAHLETLADPMPLVPVPADFEARFDRLGAEFPNAAAAVARLRDEARLRAAAGGRALSFRPLLLAGPPGVGKSRFARRLAAALGLPSAATSLAGASDSRELEGTARGWATAQPCWALDQVAALRVANPLLVVDEVDKAARGGRNGDPLLALLPFLEPGTAAAHRDPVLGAPCDVSAVSWVLAANDASRLPGPLLSRVRVVEMGPLPAGAFAAVLAAVRGDLAVELGCAPEMLPMLEGADLAWLEGRWRETRSARVLRKVYERLLAAAAARRPGRLN